MATLSWRHKSGFTETHNGLITVNVPPQGDNEIPTGGIRYIAIWGNDITGNGGRQRPYRTINKGLSDNASIIIIGTGVYREGNLNYSATRTIVGDDSNVIIDGTGIGVLFTSVSTSNISFVRVQVKNFANVIAYTSNVLTVHKSSFENCGWNSALITANPSTGYSFFDSLFYNRKINSLEQNVLPAFGGFGINRISKCTFVNMNFIQLRNNGTINERNFGNNFYNCHLSWQGSNTFKYSNFYACAFHFSSGNPTVPANYPLNTPIGAGFTAGAGISGSTINDLAGLVAAHTAAFGATATFEGCTLLSPSFNCWDINDFTLSNTSAIKNADFDGKEMGAFGVSTLLKFDNVAASSDFAVYNNITVVDDGNKDYAQLTNSSLVGGFVQKATQIDLGSVREIKRFPLFGNIADRNGEWFSAEKDTADTTIAGGTNVLTAATSYAVEIGTITWNGNTLSAGSKFTVPNDTGVPATDQNQKSFTTSEGGVVREIFQTPTRHALTVEFNDRDPSVPSFWLTHKFLWNEDVRVNRSGDTSGGTILRGNGDPAFDWTPSKQFPIQARWLRFTIDWQNNNLTP